MGCINDFGVLDVDCVGVILVFFWPHCLRIRARIEAELFFLALVILRICGLLVIQGLLLMVEAAFLVELLQLLDDLEALLYLLVAGFDLLLCNTSVGIVRG